MVQKIGQADNKHINNEAYALTSICITACFTARCFVSKF